MKKLLMFVAVLLVAATPAKAQHNYPGFEIFGGYSYLNVDVDALLNCARAIVR